MRPQAEDHLGLAFGLALLFAKQRRMQECDVDDAKQEAFLGLSTSVKNYDKERKIPFSGYARKVIISRLYKWWHRRGIIQMPDRQYKQKQVFVKKLVNANLWTYENHLQSTFLEEMQAALEKLPSRESDILKQRYGLGTEKKSLQEIGSQYNRTKEWCRLEQVKAEGKMLKLMGGL